MSTITRAFAFVAPLVLLTSSCMRPETAQQVGKDNVDITTGYVKGAAGAVKDAASEAGKKFEEKLTDPETYRKFRERGRHASEKTHETIDAIREGWKQGAPTPEQP